MINIIEYLLSGDTNKKKFHKGSTEKPKKNCDEQDVINWLDNICLDANIDNWSKDHKWPEKMKEGECGWRIEKNNWGEPSIYFTNQYCEHGDRTVRIFTKRGGTEVSYGYIGPKVDLDFDEALEFIEEIIKKPTEYIDAKEWRKERRTKKGYLVK